MFMVFSVDVTFFCHSVFCVIFTLDDVYAKYCILYLDSAINTFKLMQLFFSDIAGTIYLPASDCGKGDSFTTCYG